MVSNLATAHKEMDSNDIDRVVATLNKLFPNVSDLLMPNLGLYTQGISVPHFLPADDKFIQICKVFDHWVCATNILCSVLRE